MIGRVHSDANYNHLMMGYAAGALDEAQTLIISAHSWFSPDARTLVRHYESMGGHLLEEECVPVKLSDGCLDAVMARLEEASSPEKEICQSYEKACGCELPKPLKNALDRYQTEMDWDRVGGGFEKIDIGLSCDASQARFLKADPGSKSPEHTHGGLEITLMLNGAMSDERGTYKRGDLVITDESITHQIQACPKMGCTCLVVSSTPIKLTGIASLLNPLMRV